MIGLSEKCGSDSRLLFSINGFRHVPGCLTPSSCASISLTMKTATVREAQHHLTRLLKEVEAGEEIVLTRRGVEIAKLSPLRDRVVERDVNWASWVSEQRGWVNDGPTLDYNPVLAERISRDRQFVTNFQGPIS